MTATNEQTPSDEALLAGMASGDESSTVAFVRRYQRRVFGLAVGILSDRGAAEDVAQEALFRAWKHAPIFDTRQGLPGHPDGGRHRHEVAQRRHSERTRRYPRRATSSRGARFPLRTHRA